MIKLKRITLIFAIMLIVGVSYAQLVSIGFKDPTQGTLNLVRQENPDYPYPTPSDFPKWRVQLYTSTDMNIDLLDESGSPTGDDILASPSAPTTGHVTLSFGPNGALGISNFVFAQPGGAGNCWWGGSNVYVRLFNAPEIADATKYIVFNGMYTTPSGNAQVQIANEPINGWSEWIPISSAPEDVVIQGHFTSVNWDFTNIVIATNPVVDPDAIVIDPITGEYTIEVPAGWSGVVSPTKAGYIITPEYREYTNLNADIEDEDYAITKYVDPNVPVITYPAAGEVFTWEEAAPITFTWEAPATGFAPEYYEVKLNDVEWITLGNVLAWTSDALGEGEYTFFVRAVINTALGKVKSPLKASLSSTFGTVASKGAGPVASVEFQVIIETTEPDIPANTPTPIAPGVEIESDIDLDYGDPTPAQNAVIVALPNFDNLNDTVVTVLTGTGTTDLTFTIDTPGTWYGMIYVGGNWAQATPFPLIVPPSGTLTFVGVNFDAKGDVIVVLGEGADPTLPVELSSFNAVLTAQNFVKLSWTSESETNMLGYRVYRSETEIQAEAQLITPIMIEATNTSTTQHYGIEDKEVSVGNTYYYWLEAVDYSHSTFYGYRSVEVVGEIVPELPVSSVMGNAYPNPFKATTNTKIDVRVKAGENANVTIYNVLGQVVKSYKVPEGAHTINWDGRDNKGKLCGSGIYFYKMSTPSTNQTKKMVIVK